MKQNQWVRAFLGGMMLAVMLGQVAARAEPLQMLEAHFIFRIQDENGQWQLFEDTDVPLIPGRVCYSWLLKLNRSEGLVRFREEFRLPASPRDWGGAEADDLSTTTLTEDMRLGVTERFAPLEEGWLSHGWCVTEGDPAGAHSIRVLVDGVEMTSFAFELY